VSFEAFQNPQTSFLRLARKEARLAA
jgi:hypothetical protein